MNVKAWTEKVTIPTYQVGEPDKNPMFFEKRVYQGSSGSVYPNPIIEKIYDEKIEVDYEAVYLENRYLKIMILPELGGRVQMAFDKIKQRHFIYYNQVIKPALVGLCGPWISGGIEFNWPQHHRPSTFEPVEYSISENADGSATVWVNEVEKMFHTKGMAGFTLHPDKAYLEIKAKLNNLTALPQTFLWWANPAVKVNDDYQSIFPPDVNAVFDHGKRDVSSFPIATGTYYKVNYAPGTDISRYSNIPVPTSYMAVNSKYNFMGGYEHDTKAGMLHIADYHVSPGKKQWTWGNGEFGKAWDRNLTDEDGPYIELMAGVFTDNQPDFTWLKPFEEKTFTQYFLPYRELGMVKNASKDILLSLETEGEIIILKLMTTSKLGIRIELCYDNKQIAGKRLVLSPEDSYREEFATGTSLDAEKCRIAIFDYNDQLLLQYQPHNQDKEPVVPEPAKPALLPEEVESSEELYLTGVHLEQYRHATYSALPYYQEAIKRNPSDWRSNNAIGMWNLRRGRFSESVPYFKRAIATITSRNPNAYDCEPYYNLGLAQLFLEDLDSAYEAFFKAVWDKNLQDSAYFQIAQIDFIRGDYATGLEHINDAIDRNARNGKALVLKSLLLSRCNSTVEAEETINMALERDHFNLTALYEKYLSLSESGDQQYASSALEILRSRTGISAHNAIEYAIDYLMIGEYQKAVDFIEILNIQTVAQPLVNYYLAFASHKQGLADQSLLYLLEANNADPKYCFPNRLFDVLVLQSALNTRPEDDKASYYLGNLFYDKQQYDLAMEYWNTSAQLNPDFPTVLRNLGQGHYNKRKDSKKAMELYQKAFSLDTSDARVLMELDSLHRKLNHRPENRLAFLEKHRQVVELRDDLYLELASLYNFLGEQQKTYDMLMGRKFHPWEGGEGRVAAQYVYSLVQLAIQHFGQAEFERALSFLEKAQYYPDNLGEGKLTGANDNEIFFWIGCCLDRLDKKEEAKSAWEKATFGAVELGMALFYNDQKPEDIFYQGCAYAKLGKKDKADGIFTKLINYGEQHMNDEVRLDYFAVSLPDLLIFDSDLNITNKVHCLLMAALGYLGNGNVPKAKDYFDRVLKIDAMNFCAISHIVALENELSIA